MSDFNAGIEAAAKVTDDHIAAHRASLETIARRPDVAEVITAIIRDLEALAVKQRGLKR